MKLIKKEYKHNDCVELNNELDSFISSLEKCLEGLNENYMDITLDSKNHKEKEWSELYADPHAWLDTQLLRSERDILETILNKLNDIVYTESIHIIVNKRQPYLKANQSREWLIDNVKPLIKNGENVQTEIAKKLNTNNQLISDRVKRAYGVKWKLYVEGVQHGRY